jgi:hypothetical protein
LSGCSSQSSSPTETEPPTSTPSPSPTPSPTPLPFDSATASACEQVNLPQPTPTGGFEPKAYPSYPEPLTSDSAERFAEAFEEAYEYNRYLAEDVRSDTRELSYNPRVAEELTEAVRDGFLVGVEGTRGTLEDGVYSDDPIVGIYYLTPEFALRGEIQQPTLYDVEALREVDVTGQRLVFCSAPA